MLISTDDPNNDSKFVRLVRGNCGKRQRTNKKRYVRSVVSEMVKFSEVKEKGYWQNFLIQDWRDELNNRKYPSWKLV